MKRTRSACPEKHWVKFQLGLRSLKLETVAKEANVSVSMVSQVISGVKNSEAVGLALARLLEFASYKDLMDTACRQAKRGVA